MNQRWKKMGDEAEGAFEHCYTNVAPKQNVVRYGLDRAPINVASLPAFVRYTPDFLTARGLVEVQGFGRDQIFKIKDDKLEALFEWQHTGGVLHLWVWDSANSEYAWVRIGDLDIVLHEAALNHEVDDHGGPWPDDAGVYKDQFPEGKPYWAVHKGFLPTVDGWHPMDPPS